VKRFVMIALLGAAAGGGCQRDSSAPPGGGVLEHQLPTHAQEKLPTVRLWLGAEEVSTEMATTGIEQETGMMFRTNLAENAGMIFDLPYPQHASFWMTNCPLSLSAAYIDPNGEILEIHDLHANDTNSVVSKSADILYVLEVNQGWFARHHIEPGTIVRSEAGTLRETFSRPNR
jgi:uncharacterized membrane protein (UPF0127 family)